MTFSNRRALFLAIMWLSVSTAVNAEPIPFNFSGPLFATSGTAPQQPGDIAVGSFVLDPGTLTVTEESSEHRRFEGPVDLRLSFRRPSGDVVVQYDLQDFPLNLVINNDVLSFADESRYDAFRFGIGRAEDLFSLGVFLVDPTGTAFSDMNLPTELNLLDFNGPNNRRFFGSYLNPAGGIVGQFDGYVTFLNGVSAPEPVPEPGTLSLLIGGGALALLRRRRTEEPAGSSDIPERVH